MFTPKRILALFLLLFMIAGICTGCSQNNKRFRTMEDFKEAKIGVLTGSSFDLLSKEYFPEADPLYYMNITDLILNLKQGKVDGILMDMGFFTPILWEDTSLTYIKMDMPATEYGVAFPKNAKSEKLKAEMDAFIQASQKNGLLEELNEKWFNASEPECVLNLDDLTGKNGTLRIATTVESKPFAYMSDGAFCGFDADFIYYFAMEYGYALEIDIMDFGALLPNLSADRYDLSLSGITITEERRESVLFSEVYYSSPIVMAVMADAAAGIVGNSPDDYAKGQIGVITGSSHDGMISEMFPEAEKVYFNTMADMMFAVEQGKIDCYIEDEPFIPPLIWEGMKLKGLDEAVGEVQNAFVFPQSEKSRALREEVSAFIDKKKADGTIDRLLSKWFGDTEPTDVPDYASLTGKNGTIKLAISVDNKPVLYQRGAGYTGFEMELLTLFAKEADYAFDIEVVPFESIVAGISAGKYDMGASSLNVTSEREESVDFSTPYTTFDVVMVVRSDTAAEKKMTLADLENATIGIVTGTSWDLIAKTDYPNATRKYFNTNADMLIALEQGKLDAYFADKPVFAAMQWENHIVDCIDEPVTNFSYGIIMAKEGYDENLLAQLNAFIAKLKKEGTLAELDAKWFGSAEPTEHPDYTKLTGTNGTLKVALDDSMKPSAYRKGSMYTGYEVDFLTMFAEEYGYKLDIQGMSFDALIPSVVSGKVDIGASGITITEERRESVTFTDSHFETYGVAVIRKNESGSSASRIQKEADLENATIAILTGTIWDNVLKERLPNAEIKYFTGMTDMILALDQGKVDAILGDNTYYVNALWENVPVTTLDETVNHVDCGIIMAKDGYDPKLLEQLNEFIAKARTDGTMKALEEKWLSDSEPKEHPDYESLTGTNGTLKVAVENAGRPMTYKKENGFTGLDVEFMTLFAREYGYKLEFIGMSFDALIPTVSVGKCDVGICGIGITAERAESVTYTDSYVAITGVYIVNKETATAAKDGMFSKIAESFEKTFIRENRWQLILKGIGVTMLISLCAAVAGTLLGFGLYMLSRSDIKAVQAAAKGFAKGYSRMIAGTPVVVILMILFYVIFGSIRDISGIFVAIIGFTLTFGAFVYDHMTVSVGSVDRGQTEAAFALGYTKNQTFFRIIFPQAMNIFLPSYCGQAVELIKATAVVGYIAVNDLTKMGDIIRSNTYEAFFPLIATAVIYFLLTWGMSLLLNLVKIRFEPKRRSAEVILKGVTIK